jgi:predicted O-methyltransferase YrrM
MLPERKQVSINEPWLMPEVIQWLEAILRRDTVMLETGAGGSTVWLAQRVGHLITYENNFAWAGRVRHRLEQSKTDGFRCPVDLRFVEAYPTAGLTMLPPLDVAMIDGRGRVRSVIDALPCIKSGGWLILDDSDRERYVEALRLAREASTVQIVFNDSDGNETMAWRKR